MLPSSRKLLENNGRQHFMLLRQDRTCDMFKRRDGSPAAPWISRPNVGDALPFLGMLELSSPIAEVMSG